MERTLILIKPDAVQRGLSGKIISRIEDKGLKLIGMKLIHVFAEEYREFYEIDSLLKDKGDLKGFIP